MPDRKTRVLVVIANLGQGGAERFAYELVKALNRDRFEVELLTKRRPQPRDWYDEKIQALGIRIHRRLPVFLHYLRRLIPGVFRVAPLRWVIESLHRIVAHFTLGDLLEQFDVIEVVQIEYYYLIQPLLKNNDKVLIHLMSAGFQYTKEKPYAECRADRKYRFVVFDPSFVNDYSDSPCRGAEVLDFPLAIDLSGVPDLSSFARIEPPYKIAMFIRVSPERPVHGVLMALRRITESVDAHLTWFGHGDSSLYSPLLDELGIRDRVSFPGQARSIEQTLRTEGFSFVYTTGAGATMGYAGVEVASYGFPLLVWNQHDMPHERVLAETSGALHAHHDPNALATETLHLLQNPEQFRELGRSLREYMLTAYDMKRNVWKLEAKLEEIARSVNA
jgi:glycosyltransferase involved in cell wall biosynthesis